MRAVGIFTIGTKTTQCNCVHHSHHKSHHKKKKKMAVAGPFELELEAILEVKAYL